MTSPETHIPELVASHPHLIPEEVANPWVESDLELKKPVQLQLDQQLDQQQDQPRLTEAQSQLAAAALPESRASLYTGVVRKAERTGKDVTDLI